MQKPLMLAYILFIFICIVYHIVCQITGWNFDTWNKIIIAVTVASYFFSVNSLNKMRLKKDEEIKALLSEEFILFNRFKKKLIKEEDAPILERVIDLIENLEISIALSVKAINRSAIKVFVFDVLGYLVFFLIMGIDGLSELFFDSTDLITLVAFMVVLLVDYLENTTIETFEERSKQIKEESKKCLDTIMSDN